MRFSRKTEYALRALVELAAGGAGESLQAQELARREHIPVKFLEQILLAMRHAGLVQSRRGAGGGYSLARPAGGISLGDVLQAVEGPLVLLDCIAGERPETCSCDDMESCGLRSVVVEVRDGMADLLGGVTLESIGARHAELRQRRTGVPEYVI